MGVKMGMPLQAILEGMGTHLGDVTAPEHGSGREERVVLEIVAEILPGLERKRQVRDLGPCSNAAATERARGDIAAKAWEHGVVAFHT